MGRGRIAGILSRVKCKHVHSACADLEPVDQGHFAVSVENTCIEFAIGIISPEHTDETGTKWSVSFGKRRPWKEGLLLGRCGRKKVNFWEQETEREREKERERERGRERERERVRERRNEGGRETATCTRRWTFALENTAKDHQRSSQKFRSQIGNMTANSTTCLRPCWLCVERLKPC